MLLVNLSKFCRACVKKFMPNPSRQERREQARELGYRLMRENFSLWELVKYWWKVLRKKKI